MSCPSASCHKLLIYKGIFHAHAIYMTDEQRWPAYAYGCRSWEELCQNCTGGGRRYLKFVVCFIVACLLFVPGTAFAEISHNGQTVDAGDSVTINDDGSCPGHTFSGHSEDGWNVMGGQHITISGGTHKITLSNLTIDDPGTGNSAINVQDGANVTLVLEGANYVEGAYNHPAIWVEEGSSLTIEGSGSLEAHAGSASVSTGAAAIGGGYNGDAFGDITINGGTVIAYGSTGGAGIGGGYMVGDGSQSGDITINGGIVKAYGGSSANTNGAGIGSGENADYAGTIIINGGLVYADGGDGAMSIGAGGREIGDNTSGTFSTGTGGNAVIVAPDGIGPTTGYENWDGIFVSYEGTEGTATAVLDQNGDIDTVTLNDTGSNIQVWGEPSLDYNLTIANGTVLRVVANDRNWDYSALQMEAGTTLTNNGSIVLGRMTDVPAGETDESMLVLWGGIDQAQGTGSLQVTEPASAKILLTEELVTVDPTTFTYNGKDQRPAVGVEMTIWNYQHTFVADEDYELAGMPAADQSVDAGDYKVAVKPIGKVDPAAGDLLGNTTVDASYTIEPADFTINVPSEWSVREGENALVSKLPSLDNGVSLSIGSGITDDMTGLLAGTLTWYTDQSCTQPVADDSLVDKAAGDQVTLYWRFEHADGNFVTPKTGSMTVVISEFDVPTVSFPGVTNNAINVTYGEAGKKVEPTFTLNGQPLNPPAGDLAWKSSNTDVVTVDDEGNLEFTGAGTATVTVTLAEGNDPDNPYASITGTVTVTVAPKQISVEKGSAQVTPRDYDGTTDVEITGAKLEDGSIINNDDAELVATGKLADANAGDGKSVTISYSLEGTDAQNYVLTPASEQATVTISKADPADAGITANSVEQVIYNGLKRDYYVSLDRLVPAQLGISSFKLGDVDIEQTGYFEESDLSIANVRWLKVPVADVDSTYAGIVARVDITIVSTNYKDVTGTVTIVSENATLHTITASAGNGGSIDPAGAVEVVEGEDASFTFTPDTGYVVDDVMVDGVSQGALDSYTFQDVAGDHEISVSFKLADQQGGSGSGQGGSGQAGDGSSEGALAATGDQALMAAVGTIVLAGAALGVGVALRRRVQ